MQVRVFKKTQDDWYGNYRIVDDARVSDLVEVSFLKLYGGDAQWRVCVWGNDDCGVERDFQEEAEAWNMFLIVIGREFVNRDFLIEQGFISA